MNNYIKDNPSNHSKQGEAVERQLKRRWLLKNILIFFGCIALLILLKYQVANEWNNHPIVNLIFYVFMAFLFLASLISLLRAIYEYRS